MKKKLLLGMLMGIVILSGCTSYSIPRTHIDAQLHLTGQDIIVKNTVRGSDSAFGLVFFNFFAKTDERAIANAAGNATMQAYERDGADFIFAPKSKIKYYNFLLFDYAHAEVVAKSAIVK